MNLPKITDAFRLLAKKIYRGASVRVDFGRDIRRQFNAFCDPEFLKKVLKNAFYRVKIGLRLVLPLGVVDFTGDYAGKHEIFLRTGVFLGNRTDLEVSLAYLVGPKILLSVVIVVFKTIKNACGQVLTWKSFTPNYKTHKSKKNRGEREQYLFRQHHTPIIPPDDFFAVQKMIANAKYGGRSFIPEQRVNSGGALHGFVSVNPRWGAFKAEDYILASNSAGGAERNNISPEECISDEGLQGYEIVRVQFFNTARMTSGTFYRRNAWFSGECVRALGGAEYIELLVHPAEKLLAVRECPPDHRNAIHWARFVGDKIATRRHGVYPIPNSSKN